MSPTLSRLALVSALVPSLAVATGITSVVCTDSSLSWSFNRAGDTPCLVAANLGAVCSSTGDYTIPPLEPPVNQNFYTPSIKPTPCECSGVLYNLASACGLCQGGQTATWNFWTTNCTAISPGTYPFPIPFGTEVPHWAYTDFSSSKFNPTTAQAAGDGPESTGVAAATTAAVTGGGGGASSSVPFAPLPSSGSSGNSPFNSPAPLPLPNAPKSGKSSGTNAGAIAGGVVGGVLGLTIIGVLLFCFMRKRNTNAPSPATNYDNGMQQTPLFENRQVYGGGVPTSPAPEAGSQYAQPSVNSQQRPYDPADPSTFPGSPNSFGGSTTMTQPDRYSTQSPLIPMGGQMGYASNQSQHGSSNTTPLGAHRPGGYSGVAEL